MRTKLLFLTATLALAGCSLAYNGSRFQGGTGTDTGMGPSDTGVDGSTPETDSGLDASTVDTGTVDGGAGPCTASSDCVGDAFCHASTCTPCDADGDHYYAADATAVECGRPAHADGGDCNDANAMVFPFNRPDCTTPLAESCPLPISFVPMLPSGLSVHETGVTPVHTLWTEGGPLHVMGRDPVAMVVGDDSPLLPISHTPNGFVAFIANDAAMRSVQAVPLAWDGPASTPETLFNGFHVGGFAMHHMRAFGASGGDYLTFAAASFMGNSQVAFSATQLGHPAVAFNAPTAFTLAHPLAGASTGGFPSVGVVLSQGNPGGVAVTTGAGMGPTLEVFGAAFSYQTGAASYVAGSWMTGAGSAVMWEASTSDVGVWNGNDAALPPPTIPLTAFIGTTPPRQLLVSARAAMDSRPLPDNSAETFVAIVPVATTTSPPLGRIAILRWRAAPAVGGDRTDAHIPDDVVVSELELGATPHLNGPAGLAIRILDDASAMIAYQDGANVVLRVIPVPPDASRPSPENPGGVNGLVLAAGENCSALDVAGGFYPDTPGAMQGVGRFGVVCMVERGTMPHTLRVRAIEACIGP
jgi:hypothetical protein